MANQKITDLTELAQANIANGDLFVIEDVSATDNKSFKWSSILGAIFGAVGTLTNKRITKRIGTTASSSTPTPDADSYDQYNVTALAADATFGAPTGTPTDGQTLVIRVKDNGSARALAYNAIYRAIGITLPTTTVISKTIYLGMIYNSADTKWDVVAYVIQA